MQDAETMMGDKTVDVRNAKPILDLRHVLVMGIIVVVISMLLDCYNHLIKDHCHFEELEEQLATVHELVEKLTMAQTAENETEGNRLNESAEK
ncbi:hypothetical protein COOONC_02911 [Cooperia oncophora]